MTDNSGFRKEEPDSIKSRISVLETLQVTSNQSIMALNDNISKLESTIVKLGDRLMEVGKPQWNALASWAGVIVVFIGLIGGSVIGSIISNQTRLESVITEHLKDYNARSLIAANIDGRQTEKITALEKAIIVLAEAHKKDFDLLLEELKDIRSENVAQHEIMRKDQAEYTRENSDRLDERMQRELTDRTKPLSDRIDRLEKMAVDRLNRLEEDYIRTHDNK